MSHKHLASLVIGALASTAFTAAFAQDEEAPPVVAKTASFSRGEIGLPVSGLTKENATKIEKALNALARTEHVCPECEYAQAESGDCPECEVALEASRKPILREVKASADRSAVTLRLHKGMQLPLSQVEAALKAETVQIQRDKLVLQEPAQLIFKAAAVEDAEAIGTALEDAKLFRTVHPLYHADSHEVRVHVMGGSKTATLGAVSGLGRSAGKTWTLNDVIWGEARTR